jgi:hypothetical protein
MAKTYVMNKKYGSIGVADLPEWLNWEEQPPRSFDILWVHPRTNIRGSGTTTGCVPITKEVADIIMSGWD